MSNINALVAAAEKLWGSSRAVEDQAKLVLAKELLEQLRSGTTKLGLTFAQAGQPLADALGDAWGSARSRAAQGKPSLKDVVASEPCFVIQGNPAMPDAKVTLDTKKLWSQSQQEETGDHPLSGSKVLDPSYWEDLPRRPSAPPCGLHARHGWCVHRASCPYDHPADAPRASELRASLAASERAGGVRFARGDGGGDGGSSAAPVRPGERECGFYMNHGYCKYSDRCRYNHPPFPADGASPAGGATLGAPVRTPSPVPAVVDEPAYNLAGLPLRPGMKICPSWQKKGLCKVGAHCPLHHPDTMPPAAPAPAAGGAPASTSSSAAAAAGAGLRQPDGVDFLDALVDAVWPPEGGKDVYLRGALAKKLLSDSYDPADVSDESREYVMAMSAAGAHLHAHWREQTLYNMHEKPFKTLGELLAGDPYLTQRGSGGDAAVVLAVGRMIRYGTSGALQRRLDALADAVWPPTKGWEDFLKGALAKRILSQQLEGGGAACLLRTAGGGQPTLFRVNAPQAGEHLRRIWHEGDHRWPSKKAEMPWKSFGALLDKNDTTWFAYEPQPGHPTNQQIVLDAARLLREGPSVLRRAARAPPVAPPPSRAASASGGGASTSGGGGAAGSGSGGGARGGAAAAARPGSRPASRGAASDDGGAVASGGGDDGASPAVYLGDTDDDEAMIAAAEAEQEPRVEFWRPDDRSPAARGWGWAEVAVRVVNPEARGAGARAAQRLAVAELAAHLDMAPVISVACATYAKHPHLLQLFVPYASLGGLEMPATVYLIDTIDAPSPGVADVLEVLKAALESPACLKVTHSCRQWMGLARRDFGITLRNYFDTQSAHHVLIQMRAETGKASAQQLQGAGDVSLSALLRAHGLHHPVRHDSETDGTKRVWQQRPMTADLITCAAADVVYLIPLAEGLAPTLAAAALEVRANWQRLGSKAQLMRTSQLPAAVVDEISRGAGPSEGTVSLLRLSRWGQMEQMQQRPPPHLS